MNQINKKIEYVKKEIDIDRAVELINITNPLSVKLKFITIKDIQDIINLGRFQGLEEARDIYDKEMKRAKEIRK
jgi:hypothetical protein